MSTISDLELTGEQIKALRTMADGAASDDAKVQTSQDPDYQSALQAYCDAFQSGDDQKISDAQNRLEDIRDQQNIDPSIDIAITQQARQKAAAAVKLLSSSQIANYLSEHGDDVPDAADTIIDAIDQCRDATDADFESIRAEASSQAALLVAGLDPDAQRKVAGQVKDLLTKARQMSARAFKNREPNLDAQARKIATVDGFLALRHWMEREMAELLSNPQLASALPAGQ